jgi:hypothetical protein
MYSALRGGQPPDIHTGLCHRDVAHRQGRAVLQDDNESVMRVLYRLNSCRRHAVNSIWKSCRYSEDNTLWASTFSRTFIQRLTTVNDLSYT